MVNKRNVPIIYLKFNIFYFQLWPYRELLETVWDTPASWNP